MGRRTRYADGSGTITVDGSALALPLEIAASRRARGRGLLGRTGIEGVLLLTPAHSIHTFGMRFAVDVAYLDRELRVLDVHTVAPNRLPLPRPRARHVLEAEVGGWSRWGVRRGVLLRINSLAP
ncbi:DUF192 domain-containing protein [Streptomyces sp. NPDC004111]|uniref:DUF192 domain-containing protein n=1 Tax=Streptomyces sp. NPDC004111 TaxID=3364690 RepID=UPI0036CEA36B